jgi:hypothetical protein
VLGLLRSWFTGTPLAAPPAPVAPTTQSQPPGSVLRQFSRTSELAGDGSKIIGYFNPHRVTLKVRKMMLNDPLIAFGIAIHRSAITNLKWSVESRDEEVAAFVETVLERIYDNLAMAASMAIPLGWQVVEKVWAVEDLLVEVKRRKDGQISATDKLFPNAWVIEKTKGIPHESLRLLVDPEKDEWAGVEQSGSGTLEAKRVDRERVILWSHRAEEVGGELTGHSLLDQAYEPWWFGVAHELHTNRYFERKGEPVAKGHAPAEIMGPGGQMISGWSWLAEQAVGSRNGGAIIMDGKTDDKGNRLMDLAYLQDEARGDMFVERMDRLETRKLRGLLITDRVMAAGAGGLGTGDAELQADVLGMSLEANAKHFLGSVMNPQVVDDLVRFNFGEERWKQSRTRVVAGGLSPSLRDLTKDVIKTVLQADSMIADGRPTLLLERLDIEGVARAHNLPMRPAQEIAQMEESRRKAQEDAAAAASANQDPELSDEGADQARKDMERRGVKDRRGSGKDE